MTRRSYVTSGRMAELARALGAEEAFVLSHLAVMRLATAGQLQTLAGVQGEAAIRRFRRLLARMTEDRLIGRLERRIGGVRAGSAGFVYRLDIAGQRLVEPGSLGRRPWTPRPSWLAHALTVSQLYVDLATMPTAKLLGFEAEPASWRPFADGYSRQLLKPDGFAHLAIADGELLVYLEVDRRTESPATLRHKLEAYHRFWLGGGAQHTYGVMPLVVWTVPDQRRLQVIQGLVESQSPEAQVLHKVALQSEAVGQLAGINK